MKDWFKLFWGFYVFVFVVVGAYYYKHNDQSTSRTPASTQPYGKYFSFEKY